MRKRSFQPLRSCALRQCDVIQYIIKQDASQAFFVFLPA
jgi:hypothetical protein